MNSEKNFLYNERYIMSLFNINTQESRNYDSTIGWNTNLDKTRVNENTRYDLVSLPSGFIPTDRYSYHSDIKSTTSENVSNQDTKKSYFSPLPLLNTNSTRSFRQNFYNSHKNSFVPGFPNTTKYFLPTQKLTNTFNVKNTFDRPAPPELALPENYTDIFANKSIQLIPFTVDFVVSDTLQTVVYSTECAENEDCAGQTVIKAYFIKPSYDINNNDYDEFNNFGIAFDTGFDATYFDFVSIDITHQDETIMSIVYDLSLQNTEVVLKHPALSEDVAIILPDTDQTISI